LCHVFSFESTSNFILGDDLPDEINLYKIEGLLFDFMSCFPFSISVLEDSLTNKEKLFDLIEKVESKSNVVNVPMELLSSPLILLSDSLDLKMQYLSLHEESRAMILRTKAIAAQVITQSHTGEITHEINYISTVLHQRNLQILLSFVRREETEEAGLSSEHLFTTITRLNGIFAHYTEPLNAVFYE
jgi:hypothetical protein